MCAGFVFQQQVAEGDSPIVLAVGKVLVCARMESRGFGESKEARGLKVILYYTCNTHPLNIETACRNHLLAIRGDMPLITVSLNQPIDFGDVRITMEGKRSPEMMHRQILTGLEQVEPGSTVFMAESDVLYHPSHYDFEPPRTNVFYYNENTWKVDSATGQALFYYTKQLSGCCAYSNLLLGHYRKRMARIEEVGRYEHGLGYEPGCHPWPRGVDPYIADRWMSPVCNVDIRHPQTQTKNRWSQDQFRNKSTCLGWTMADNVPGWGRTKGRFDEFLKDVEVQYECR